MPSQFIFLLLVISNVCSDDLTVFHVNNFDKNAEELATHSPKFLDIYTNHGDFKKVLSNYYDVTRRPNHRRFEAVPSILHESGIFKSFPRVEKITPTELEDTVHLDRIDFHYPSIEFFPDENDQLESNFGTIVNGDVQNNEKFVFMQSQKVTTEGSDEDNLYQISRRPKFKTQKHERLNSSYSSPVTLTYVQKIPKLKSNHSTNNRYEELELNSTKKTETVKNKINGLLKRYLEKLYSRKYNGTSANSIRPSSYSKFNSDSDMTDDMKSKFLDSNALLTLKNKTINKINNLFSLFTVVQFNNTQCNATNTVGTYQGICYTAAECTSQSGTALGNCASGFGVCCVCRGTCGGSASQNCSYFESPNYPDYYPGGNGVVVPTTTVAPSNTPDPRLGWFYRNKWGRQSGDTLSCTFSVYKSNSNISKMRIDFLDLELTGPTNGTCTNERLIISGQNSNSQVPIICGYNTGQHVYVDVSSLSGPLQLSVLSSTASRKRFRIRICQFEDSCMEPSSNCLQYYTGITGVISSFNYDQASTLVRSVPGYFNNLNYAICIRREEGYCSITYTNVVNGMEYPFQLVNVDDFGMPVLAPGQAGADIFNCPDDYIVIGSTRLCGDKLNDGTTNDDFTMNAPVTDTGAGPIVIPVRTDSSVTGLGFKLFYTQNRCTS